MWQLNNLRLGKSLSSSGSGVTAGNPSLNLNFLGTSTLNPLVTFTRASSGTYFDSTGTLQTAGNNTARFDYNPSTLDARGMLVEEQRTNLFLQSEDFGTSWTASNVTVTTNTTNSPANTTTADTITPAASTAVHGVQQSVSVSASTAYSVSVFVKGDGAPFVQISYDNGASVGAWINVNLSNGSITRGPELAGGATNVTGGVDSIGNGWYRIRVGATHTGTTSRVIIQPLPSGQSLSGINPSTTTAVTDKIIVWGAQLEAGAFATSYIATTAASATRAADVASVNTLSPWYNASAGTLYAEFSSPVPNSVSVAAVIVGFDDGTANNRFSNFYTIGSGVSTVAANQLIGGSASFGGNQISAASGVTLSNVQKLATRFQAANYAASSNGNAVVTDAFSLSPPSVNTLRIGIRPSGTQANLWLRRVIYYPRGLTNAALQSLTA